MLQRTDKKSAAAYCDEFRGPRTPRPAPYRLRNSRSPRAPPQRHGGSHAARASRMVAAPDHAIVRAAMTARIPLRAAFRWHPPCSCGDHRYARPRHAAAGRRRPMKPITRSTGARVVAALIVALLLGAGTARAVKVDFLWIIDNSPSMADKQATLSAAADNIASQLANASCSMDWRMAVAYTDAQVAPSSNDVCSGSPGPGRRRVCPFTSDINVFKNGTAQCAYVKAGTCGDSTERGFSSAAIAIDDFLAGSGCAAVPGTDCALRPDARLVNIFFTDTGEQTPASSPAPGEGDDSVSSWLKYFDDYDLMAPGMQRAQVHGILCPFRPTPSNPAPCGDTLADPTLFDRYSSVIAQMGGTEGSIADLSHLSEAITAIVDASIAGACCGNGHLDPGEECDDGNLNDGDCCSSSCKIESSTTMCRAAAGPCDVAEFCTGTSSTCPADDFKPATFQCRGATGACDVAEFCSGASATCPADVLRPSTFECRPSVGACDLAEFCTGTSGLCPSDAKSTGTCRAAAGSCDVAESCDGVSNDCPADAFKASSVKCRAARATSRSSAPAPTPRAPPIRRAPAYAARRQATATWRTAATASPTTARPTPSPRPARNAAPPPASATWPRPAPERMRPARPTPSFRPARSAVPPPASATWPRPAPARMRPAPRTTSAPTSAAPRRAPVTRRNGATGRPTPAPPTY
ncbi:MAG: hypothetical protein E6J56_14000 [Deltaproteobacteria bacterium]|nr:MAG: hypothetical protein E6J56_14000 [Deltaproteobacteria bacterium]